MQIYCIGMFIDYIIISLPPPSNKKEKRLDRVYKLIMNIIIKKNKEIKK